ncbi:hypothetical protein, partial [Klebsiella aerogenes]|uniref:hypothetical protein n=1 Tax=Klebsiella aerogenes TaxID=548 RepID=UPI00195419AF
MPSHLLEQQQHAQQVPTVGQLLEAALLGDLGVVLGQPVRCLASSLYSKASSILPDPMANAMLLLQI